MHLPNYVRLAYVITDLVQIERSVCFLEKGKGYLRGIGEVGNHAFGVN